VEADSSCWDARQTEGYGGNRSPKEPDGCVRRWHWTLFGW
jgi:hypothetical protein